VTRIGELGTTLAATSNQRATRRNIPEDTILQFLKCLYFYGTFIQRALMHWKFFLKA
jgi:hypothetical protein